MNTKWIQTKEKVSDTALFSFTKKFTHSGKLILKISASTRYQLYINGKFALEGPCQGTAYENYYEEADISSYLRNGENELRVLVLHVADNVFTTVFPADRPILWVEGTDENKPVIRSDASWHAHKISGRDFVRSDFIFIMHSVCPFEHLRETLTETPVEIEEGNAANLQNDGFDEWGAKGTLCLKKSPLPQMETRAEHPTKICKTTETGYVLDACCYTTAKVRVKVRGTKGDVLRLTYGECFLKSVEGWTLKKGKRDDTSGFIKGPFDVIDLTGEEQEIEFFWYRAFRYIEVSCKDIKNLSIAVTYAPYFYPFDIAAKFSCSDESYNKIWDTSIQTLLCCSHEIFVDCPHFEQQQYDMDSYLEAMYALKISGDTRLVKKAISDLAQSQQPSGLLRANYPSRMTQIIPTFSIYWLMLLHDYYVYSGDSEFVKPYLGTVDKILWAFHNLLNENGLVSSSHWPFVDWAKTFRGGVPSDGVLSPICVYSMQYSAGLKCAAHLCKLLGREALSKEYMSRKEALDKAVRIYFRNEEKGYYNDTLTTAAFSQHTAIWAILSEIETGENAVRLARIMMDPKTVSCSFSMGFFLFRALEKVGMYDLAEANLKGFQTMLDLNCTTWCENPDDPRSECHGWSASPLYEFTTGILGVKQTGIGYKSIEINPTPWHLTHAEGAVPTPLGIVSVAWKKIDGKIHLSYSAPRGMTVTVGKDVITE